MRTIAIGRKNWLHLGSKEAGPKIAAIFSIVESCRKLNIPIRQYLLDVLPSLADRSIHSLTELTPTAYPAKLEKSPIPGYPGESTMVVPGRTRSNHQSLMHANLGTADCTTGC